MGASKFDEYVRKTNSSLTKSQAADLLIECWNRLSDDDSESDFPSGSRSSQCDGGEIDEEVYDDDEIL